MNDYHDQPLSDTFSARMVLSVEYLRDNALACEWLVTSDEGETL